MTKQRKFIAAVKQPNGSTTILWGDGDEPLEDISKAMLTCGMQPESVDALTSRSARSIAKRRALVKKIDGVRTMLRDEVGFGDDALLGILDGSLIPFSGSKGSVLLRKARRHQETGQFISADTPRTGVTVQGWHSTGAVHPALRKLAQSDAKGIPVNSDTGAREALEARAKQNFDALMAQLAAEANT